MTVALHRNAFHLFEYFPGLLGTAATEDNELFAGHGGVNKIAMGR